jgi:hypothetical protein
LYYAGALPFVLALLYFWGDMSRSAFAHQHLAGGALGVALLFLWMKLWQALFARALRAQLAGEPAPAITWRGCARIAVAQAALQPTGLFALPLAFLAALPFGWVYAFYQNVTALADAESSDALRLAKRAQHQAALWPGSNHLVLAVMVAFGLFLFLNWMSAGFALPHLLKMLTGVETVLTRGGWSLLNTTFLAVMLGLTYLCADPLLKAVYVLRCFYGESLRSGEDLKAELRRFAAPTGNGVRRALLLLALALPCQAEQLPAATPGTPAPASASAPATPAGLTPANLDRAIAEVIQQRKYAWRLPRERPAARPDKGFLARMVEGAAKMVRDGFRAVWDWLRRLFDRDRHGESRGSGYGWMLSPEVLLAALAALVLGALGWLLHGARAARRKARAAAPLLPPRAAPDLGREHVNAAELPGDEWTRLGLDLLERGEHRLALRAFYLASLAHLAQRNLITLAKAKSNREYEMELRRRAHAFPGALAIFGRNVTTFDQVWYGLREATRETAADFAANVERLKTAG